MAVQELIERFEFRLQLETWGYLSKEKRKYKGDEWFYAFMNDLEKDEEESGLFYGMIRFLPIVAFVIFLIIYQLHFYYELVLIILLLQMIISYYISYKNRMVISRVEQFCLA